MSSGAIVIAPGAVVVAAGAAVVIGAAGAAVLVVRAANAAAEGAVRAIGDYGSALEQQAERQAQAEVTAARWQAVIAEVVELNSRIRMVAERAGRSRTVVALPEPVRVSGCSVDETRTRLRSAAGLLVAAQQALLAAAMAHDEVRLPGGSGWTTDDRSRTMAELARHRQVLRDRLTAGPAAPAADARSGSAAVDPAAVDAVLRALDPDANEQEHADLLRLAALTRQDDPDEAASYLLALRGRAHEINAQVAGRRLAAQWLEALEEPVVARVDPPAPLVGTAARLRAVVAGEAELTSALRTEGLAAVAWAADVVHREFVRERVRECFVDQGYAVAEAFDVTHSAGLRLGRADWHGEHSAEVWVDSHGAVHGRVVRHVQTPQGDEARLRGRSRCRTFNEELTALGAALGAEVVIDEQHQPQYLPSADPRHEVPTQVVRGAPAPKQREVPS